MSLARKNSILSKTINVDHSANGDTLFIPHSGIVNISGILTATSGNFSSQTVFASGSAATPGISIVGDTDTGLCQISSVGTNSLSISTSGVERARFASNGDVQINTGRTISGGTGGALFGNNGINNDFVSTGRAAALSAGWATLRVNQVAAYVGLRLVGDTSQTASYMEVENSSGTNLFTINSAGNIGIGTSSPNAKLEIQGSSGVYTRLGTTSSSFYVVHNGTTDTFLYTQEASPLRIGTAATERLRITSGGNLEIKSNAGNISTLFTYNENGGELVHYDDTQTAATLLDQCANSTRLLELINGSDLLLGLGGSNTTGSVRFMRAGFNEAMRIDSTGAVGIGTSNPSTPLHVVSFATSDANKATIMLEGTVATSQSFAGIRFKHNVYTTGWGADILAIDSPNFNAHLTFRTTSGGANTSSPVERMRITSDGNVGIGTSSPSVKLDVSGLGRIGNGVSQGSPNSTNIKATAHTLLSGTGGNYLAFGQYDSGSNYAQWIQSSFDNPSTAAYNIVLQPLGGNVGIGTTTVSYRLHVVGNASAANNVVCYLNNTGGTRSRLAFQDTSTTYAPDISSIGNDIVFDTVGIQRMRIGNNGRTQFFAATEKYGVQLNNGSTGNGPFIGSDGADIFCISTAGGAERVRVDAAGNLLVATTNTNPAGNNVVGVAVSAGGYISITRDSDNPILINRKTNDGTITSYQQDGTTEGSVSVAGNTVSYNAFCGSHWAQLIDNSRPAILRGTVLDTIDEMCEWPNEPQNHRLPRVKISDTPRSRRVYGVFMAWDEDDMATGDMYVTALGAYMIRVSGLVQSGDLLESAGDGTARSQSDDIIRSSTIGKVSSTHRITEYDDGSYLVPCILMCG